MFQNALKIGLIVVVLGLVAQEANAIGRWGGCGWGRNGCYGGYGGYGYGGYGGWYGGYGNGSWGYAGYGGYGGCGPAGCGYIGGPANGGTTPPARPNPTTSSTRNLPRTA